jgi:hypothetical protein
MDAAEKVKIALDETRMLILGAQVLLGFQMRSVFQDEFEHLPGHTKLWDGIALLVLVTVVCLLIAPAIHHRMVDNGDATRRIMRAISVVMSAALGLFALSLGINIFIALERVSDHALAVAAGIAAVVLALWFWFGAEWLAVVQRRGKELIMADERVPLIKKIDQLLTDARVILQGAQALLGFQLAVILTQAFERLPSQSKAMHALALGFIALCTVLLMAPAAYHRIVFAGEASEQFHQLGSRLVIAATTALALGLAADVYVVMAKIAGQAVGVWAATLSIVTMAVMWHVSPLVMQLRR